MYYADRRRRKGFCDGATLKNLRDLIPIKEKTWRKGTRNIVDLLENILNQLLLLLTDLLGGG